MSGAEPMEVGAIRKVNDTSAAKAKGPTLEELVEGLGISELTKQLRSVQGELGKIKNSINHPPKSQPSVSSSAPPSSNSADSKNTKKKETRTCYFCNISGHIVKNCRKRLQGLKPKQEN